MLADEAKKLIPELRCVHVRLLGRETEANHATIKTRKRGLHQR